VDCKLMRIAGGVAFSVCVAPVIVILLTVKQPELACGQNVAVHWLWMGEIAVFDGMLTEYVPVPLNEPPKFVGSVPPVHVYGPTGFCGLGTKTKLKVPLFHVCAPASVMVPETVVDCEKAWAEDKRRSPSVRRTLRSIESSLWKILVPLLSVLKRFLALGDFVVDGVQHVLVNAPLDAHDCGQRHLHAHRN